MIRLPAALLALLLLQDPLRMPDYGKGTPPEPRPRAEVEAVLAGAPAPAGPARPVHLVLVAGKKDHGPGEHDYPAWQRVWKRLFARAEGVRISTALEWPSTETLETADVIVVFQRGNWTPDRLKNADALLARGGGIVVFHYAVEGRKTADDVAARIGLAWKRPGSKFRHGTLDLIFDESTKHPISRNFTRLHLHDESYWNLAGDLSKLTVLATAVEDGTPQPIVWTKEAGTGRVFGSLLGHYAWTFDDPLVRILLLRGIAWAAHQPVDRFNALAWPGARVK